MKSFWSLSAKALLVIVLLQAWFLYDMYRQNTALKSVNDEYTQYLEDSESKIAALEKQLAETEKKTVDGLLKETNKAVVDGWESLLDKVEQELEKARTAVPELFELEQPQEPNTRSDNFEPEPEPETTPDDEQNPDAATEPADGSRSTVPPVLIPSDKT